ncbi:hypothetical protein [Fibrella forsythiae]|uniref:Uncharacterized protein n=1 Tax=Fibrella forsythiae TaxID=2817061 RepID=A0ABS3JEC1_9BACT|nr:hypothetical protein [Fibrella forsythiae]MBO0948350.1 hypothetical protein [Fibrella forsythiae]
MQTVLLTIWPFLNLILYVFVFQEIIRLVNRTIPKLVYRSSILTVVLLIGAQTAPHALFEEPNQITMLQAQPTVPIRAPKFHDGLLPISPMYTIKSHISMWPVTLPDHVHMEAVDSTGKQPDAIKLNLIVTPSPLMLGLKWEQEKTSVRIAPNGTLTYEIGGHLIWRLLGVPVYYQPKEYIGKMAIQ